MPSYRLIDGNAVGYNIDTNAVGGNYAATIVPADQNGVKYSLAPGAVGLPVQAEGLKNTYRYAVLGFAPVATPTDVLELQGSGTKTVRVRRIIVEGVATAAGNMPLQLVRRSAADSGGGMTRTALTAMKADLGAGGATPNATAVVSLIETANPGALGTQEGGIGGAGRAQLTASGSGVAADRLVWEFDINAIVLRGTADFLYLNMNGAALPAGAAFDITIETQEDAS